MAKTDDLALKRVQDALEYAATLPIVAVLPQYLMRGGKVLPGINEYGGQIMTRAELDALPELEALRCRMMFVARYAGAGQRKKARKPRKRKTA